MEIRRPSWDEYFMKIAETVATRGTCPKRNVGAVLVRDKRILATGHTGSIPGAPHCTEVGCLIKYVYDENGNKHDKCMRTIHAELNTLIQCALHGISTKDATLYVTFEPCDQCAKALINAGIKRVVVGKTYDD